MLNYQRVDSEWQQIHLELKESQLPPRNSMSCSTFKMSSIPPSSLGKPTSLHHLWLQQIPTATRYSLLIKMVQRPKQNKEIPFGNQTLSWKYTIYMIYLLALGIFHSKLLNYQRVSIRILTSPSFPRNLSFLLSLCPHCHSGGTAVGRVRSVHEGRRQKA